MFVFVYGTLKKGEPNHHWLTNQDHGSAKFVGAGTTKELYPLVIASKYNIPFLLDKPGTGKVSVLKIHNICIPGLTCFKCKF